MPGGSLDRQSTGDGASRVRRWPDDSERFAALDRLRRDARAIVVHRENDVFTRDGKTNLDRMCLRVAYHIRQGLLRNSEQRHRKELTERSIVDVGLNLDVETGPLLNFTRLPFKRRDQAQLVEDPRPEFGGYPSHESHGGIDLLVHRHRAFPQSCRALVLGLRVDKSTAVATDRS